jgi:hypothetical protein
MTKAHPAGAAPAGARKVLHTCRWYVWRALNGPGLPDPHTPGARQDQLAHSRVGLSLFTSRRSWWKKNCLVVLSAVIWLLCRERNPGV